MSTHNTNIDTELELGLVFKESSISGLSAVAASSPEGIGIKPKVLNTQFPKTAFFENEDFYSEDIFKVSGTKSHDVFDDVIDLED